MIYDYIAKNYLPQLQYQLRVARISATPEEYVARVLKKTMMGTILLGMLLFMLMDQQGQPIWYTLVGIVGIFFVGAWFGFQQPKIRGYSRAKDIDREVVFAGRYLLVKLHSGRPLVNALFDAANSYGVASKYFQEIVRDIELGTPVEQAVEHAMTYSASANFRRILFQIHVALRLGMNVTKSLEAVLEDIQKEQLVMVQSYGKKLSSVTLVYMLVAVVFPSLGMTILTVLLSFTQIQLNLFTYGAVIVLLVILNFIFISIFRGIRPQVNI